MADAVTKKYLSAIPFLALAAAIAGMFIARAMVSISMMVLLGYALLITDPRKTLREFFHDRILVTLTLVFFVYLLSGIYSTEDRSFLLERIRLKIPFLVMPIAFASLKKSISARQFHSLIYLLLSLITIVSIALTFYYLRHYQTINELYDEGRVMDTPFSHIRYSLMVSFAIFAGYYLVIEKFFLRYRWERWLIAAFSIFLVFFLHLLAVRSGIVAFYLCLIYLIFHFIFRHRKVVNALLLSVAIVLLPTIAYLGLPPVKAKVNYMRYDIEQLLLFKNASGLSDAGRIMSIEKGMEIFRENFLFGVGIGDLRQEMKKKLEQAPEKPRAHLLPHNQFLFVGAGTGIIGLLVFCLAVFLPLFNRKNIRNVLFVCFHIIVFSSFFTEATVEEQMGTSFYLIFLLLMYVYIQSESS